MDRKPQKRPAKKIADYFQNEQSARAWLEAIRWPEGVIICPRCGSSAGAYRLKSGKYRCKDKDCRSDFSVTVGTVFESSHIALHKWLLAAYLLCSSKKGISAHQVHRTLGVTYKTAWFMMHRIREAMKQGGVLAPLGGPGKIVEVDETYIGRDPRRKKGTGMAHKLAVVSLVERGGKSRSIYVDTVNRKTLERIVRENVHRESEVMTDEHKGYAYLDQFVARHDTVRHGLPNDAEYARYEGPRVITTNSIEGFFSIFKRGMRGVYQHCRERHLVRYLSEFDFRYGLRFVNDTERTNEALKGAIGKRLKYRDS
jgi:transposase-like protein